MRSLRAALLGVAVLVVAGCGSSDSSGGATDGGAGSGGAAGAGAGGAAGGSGSGGTAGSDAGTGAKLDKFATLSSASGGIAFGKDVNGKTVLFVSLTAANAVAKVDPTGAVGTVASVPSPTGLALAADGTLLVCGIGPAGDQAMVYKLDPANGTSTPFAYDAATFAGKHFVSVAIAPDDRVVFSDDGSAIYRTDKDGTNISLVTAVIGQAEALAFSADGTTLFASSFFSDELWTVSRSTTIGNFFTPTRIATSIPGVTSGVVMANGDLVLVGKGVLRVHADGSNATSLVKPAELTDPAGAAFGQGAFGDTTLYIGNGSEIARLAFTDKAIALPVR